MSLPIWSQGQRRAEPFGFIFLNTLLQNGMKFGMVMKEFKLNILTLHLSETCVVKGENCFYYLC